ncbi:MAG: ABC transporter ATP-binding protein [Myxococcaceae bacterium]|nr:ABC transporter ATP-binding protein [Myxococcaceae bacterium]
MHPIQLKNLTKRYGGRRGVEGLSLEVPAGVMFGLIGPNGAGKSTAVRTLLGLLRATEGETWLLGRNTAVEGAQARADVGYVPGENQFDPGLTVRQLLEWRSSFYPGDHRARRDTLVQTFELEVSARAEDLSLGNKKKLALVAALQHRPKVLILDEPTNGLDPVMQQRLFDVLEAEARGGAAVLFSSHVLSEVQRTCKTVAVLSEGRLAAREDVEALRRRQLRRVHVQGPASGLSALAGVSSFVPSPSGATFLYSGALPPMLSALAALDPADVRIEEPSLEEIVLQHYLTPETRS